MKTFLPDQERAGTPSLRIKGRMMPYDEFSVRLKNFCGSLGFNGVEIRHFDSFDDVDGLTATTFAKDSTRDAVVVLTCRVSYNPNWGSYCGMPQLLVREKYEDAVVHCPASFITPFLQQYRFAQEHIYLTETEQGQYLITIPESILKKDGENQAGRLIIDLDRVAERDPEGHFAPVLVNGSMFSFTLSHVLYKSLAALGYAWRKGRSVPIDRYLGSDLFSFVDAERAVDSRSPFRPTLLPHLRRIVTHRTPNLKAAEIHLGHEFARAVSTFMAAHPPGSKVLCLAGLDIDMAVFAGHEEHYFVPWKACLERTSGDSEEEYALEQDDLYVRLMQQDKQ